MKSNHTTTYEYLNDFDVLERTPLFVQNMFESMNLFVNDAKQQWVIRR